MNHLLPIGGHFIKKLIFLLSFCLIVVLGAGSKQVLAQSDSARWQDPWNASLSGTAVEPVVVAAADGALHLFWQDRVGGYILLRQEGGEWLEPQPILVPFTDPPFSPVLGDADFAGFYPPLLRVDAADALHAVWLNADDELVYSRVPLAGMMVRESWSPVVVLASAVRGVDLVVGENGRLHLAYIRTTTEDAPAGIYHRFSDDGGQNWSEAAALYTSNYLRTISAAQARVQLGVTGDLTAVAWDNPLLDEILLLISSDRGETWSPEAQIVDRREPDDSPSAAGPSAVTLTTQQGAIHLVWRAQHGQESCRLYHQWSADGGQSWLERSPLLAGEESCPSAHTLFWMDEGLLLLSAQIGAGVQSQVWSNGRWSEPEPEPLLASFSDPATYRDVTLGCHQFSQDDGGNLIAIGCGRTATTEDIWVIQQTPGGLASWMVATGEPPVWRETEAVFADGSALSSVVLLAGASGDFHAFWVAADMPGRSFAGDVIYYASWDGRFWSRPTPVAVGAIDQIAATLDGDERLLLVWRDYRARDLFFSQVTVERAAFPSDWAAPREILGRETAVSHPGIIVQPDGTIWLHYALSLNEGRGIYLQSIANDEDVPREEPQKLFDAVAAQWDMVAHSELVRAADGSLHLLFYRYALPGGQAISLHYMRSTDQAESWTEPRQLAEGELSWARFLVGRGAERSPIWQATEEGSAYLWHRLSEDNGATWLESVRLVGSGDTASIADSAIDPANRLYSLQTFGVAGDLQVQTWFWDGEFWQIEQPITLPASVLAVSALNGVVGENGRFPILLIGSSLSSETGQPQDTLFFSERILDLPEGALPPRPTATPNPALPSPAMPAELVPTPTPTPDPSLIRSNSLQDGPIDTISPVESLVAGVLPALFVVAIAFGVGIWRYQRQRR